MQSLPRQADGLAAGVTALDGCKLSRSILTFLPWTQHLNSHPIAIAFWIAAGCGGRSFRPRGCLRPDGYSRLRPRVSRHVSDGVQMLGGVQSVHSYIALSTFVELGPLLDGAGFGSIAEAIPGADCGCSGSTLHESPVRARRDAAFHCGRAGDRVGSPPRPRPIAAGRPNNDASVQLPQSRRSSAMQHTPLCIGLDCISMQRGISAEWGMDSLFDRDLTRPKLPPDLQRRLRA